MKSISPSEQEFFPFIESKAQLLKGFKSRGKAKRPLNIWDKKVEVEESHYYWRGESIIFNGKISKGTKPIVVELFSGCGGTSLGFEMAGFQVALGRDIHRPSIETFKLNHPSSAAILGDIIKVKPEDVSKAIGNRRVDVLIAGVPCQGFSLNNRKRHQDDKRNFLYKEFIRFVEILQPRAIVLENVSGMQSSGDIVQRISEQISKVGKMNVTSASLCAQDYGVPQRRKRLVFVGIRNAKFDFSEVKKTHGPGTGKEYVTIKDAIGDLPSLKADGMSNKYRTKPLTDYQRLMREGVEDDILRNHKAPNHPVETIQKIKQTKPGESMYPRFKQRIRLAWNILSPTQVSGGIRPQFQFGHPSDARGLSIRERCRLQSFPDSFVISGGIVQGRVQTGNAVPPLLAKAIALAIKKHL